MAEVGQFQSVGHSKLPNLHFCIFFPRYSGWATILQYPATYLVGFRGHPFDYVRTLCLVDIIRFLWVYLRSKLIVSHLASRFALPIKYLLAVFLFQFIMKFAAW